MRTHVYSIFSKLMMTMFLLLLLLLFLLRRMKAGAVEGKTEGRGSAGERQKDFMSLRRCFYCLSYLVSIFTLRKSHLASTSTRRGTQFQRYRT